MRRSAVRAAAAGAALAVLAGAAAAECRQALVIALDISGSVDDDEYALQLEGVAGAFDDAAVRTALLSMPDAPVAVTVFEWSGGSFQREIAPWTFISGPGDIDALINRLLGWRRVAAPQSTGIGAALRYAEARLRDGPVCWRQTVDVSGDGRNNDWPEPRSFYASGGLPGVTVNALVIGQTEEGAQDAPDAGLPGLMAYFRSEVIHGPEAFAEPALGYVQYRDAMTRKLLRELETVAVGALEPGAGQ